MTKRCATNSAPISNRSSRKPDVDQNERNWRDHRDELFERVVKRGRARKRRRSVAKASLPGRGPHETDQREREEEGLQPDGLNPGDIEVKLSRLESHG